MLPCESLRPADNGGVREPIGTKAGAAGFSSFFWPDESWAANYGIKWHLSEHKNKNKSN